jgi:hypothetical protein
MTLPARSLVDLINVYKSVVWRFPVIAFLDLLGIDQRVNNLLLNKQQCFTMREYMNKKR